MAPKLWDLRLQMMETDWRLSTNANRDLMAKDFLGVFNIFTSALLQNSTDLEWSA